MAGQKLKSARSIAAEVLNRCDPKRNYAGTIMDSLRHETDQSQRATDLVFGTLRNRRAIDKVIATFSGRPIKRIQEKLLNIIRIGTYELIYCPSTEQYAIVNEAVAICRGASRTALAKQSGFVNAVLRQITRHIKNRQIPLTEGEPGRTIPQTLIAGHEPRGVYGRKPNVVYGCQFDTSFLPNQQERPAKYLSTVFSLPEWLIAGWLNEFGEESTWRICLASNRRPSIYLRPNPLKTIIYTLAQKLGDAGVDLEINTDDSIIRIISPQAISQLPGFGQGEFSVQDLSASMPVKMLNPQAGWTILDLCAAPGTKTTQLAEVTGDLARIIATDINNRRLEMVKENIARLGIKSVDIVPYEELLNSESRFDCILLDVPCSNTGVLARRVEARYRINPEAIEKLSDTQTGLLKTAAEMLKPGGKICYSTCSIRKCENSEQIEDFLKKNQDFTLELEQLTLPSLEGFDHDGGYVAVLSKSGTEI